MLNLLSYVLVRKGGVDMRGSSRLHVSCSLRPRPEAMDDHCVATGTSHQKH